MGNHEKMLIEAMGAGDEYDLAVKKNRWAINGGNATIQSYDNGFDTIPDSHKDFS